MQVENFFDSNTFTHTYVLYDEQSRDAIVIDPVYDYDAASSTLKTQSVQKVIDFIRKNKLKLHLSLETHAHADHISAGQILKKHFNIPVGIGENITKVQEVFKDIYHLPNQPTDGRPFDLLLKEGQSYEWGTLKAKVIHTPGHTPACSCYLFENVLFSGDALFMPDFGTGRCDFPKGDAKQLFHSITRKLYSLPDNTIVFVGHDYGTGGREILYKTTIGESKKSNKHVKMGTSEEEFLNFRINRDKELSVPNLLLPSIQVNINGGKLPEKETNGRSYLKIPLTLE